MNRKVKEKDIEAIIADILMKLNERFNLIEYDEMTAPVFVTTIFLEEATDILANKPEGDIDALRAQVKQTEASLCYMHWSSRTAKSTRETRWCGNANYKITLYFL